MIQVHTYERSEIVAAIQLRAGLCRDNEGETGWLTNAYEIKEWMGLAKGVEIEENTSHGGAVHFVALHYDRDGVKWTAHRGNFIVRDSEGRFSMIAGRAFRETHNLIRQE